MPDGPAGPFELRIPPDPVHVATARLFVASLARTAGWEEGRVDDLRLAVSEAVSAAMVAYPDTEVVVSGTIESGILNLRVAPISEGALSDDRFDVESIVASLFDGARFDGDAIVIPSVG